MCELCFRVRRKWLILFLVYSGNFRNLFATHINASATKFEDEQLAMAIFAFAKLTVNRRACQCVCASAKAVLPKWTTFCRFVRERSTTNVCVCVCVCVEHAYNQFTTLNTFHFDSSYTNKKQKIYRRRMNSSMLFGINSRWLCGTNFGQRIRTNTGSSGKHTRPKQ